jgi:signal transduction histidine kinase
MTAQSLLRHFRDTWNRLARPRPRPAGDTAYDGLQELAGRPAASPTQEAGDADGEDEIRYPRVGMLLLIWSAVGVLNSARYAFLPTRAAPPFSLSWVLVWVAAFVPWAFLSPVAFRLERRFPLGTTGWGRNLAQLALRSVPICLLGALLTFLAVSFVWWLMIAPPPVKELGFGMVKFWLAKFPLAAVCFWCSVAAGCFVRSHHELRAHERRAARLALAKSQLEAGLNQAQLEALRAKLNPHFLFNSLQNISVLTRDDPQTAGRMLTRLGDLLRAVLRQGSAAETTLREEIELTQAYVALEQLRFGDRLRVAFEIAPEVQAALVPCFVLQPLIENAVVHGLRGLRKEGRVTVSATRQTSELVLCVADNGVGLPPREQADLKVGVGLGSTRERLVRMYPGRHGFVISGAPQGGTEVRITLPLRFETADVEGSGDE